MTIPGWVGRTQNSISCESPPYLVSFRALGEVQGSEKPLPNRNASKSFQVSTRQHEPTMARRISSFLRRGTRNWRSIWSRTSLTRTRARHSSSEQWGFRWGRNGIPGWGSREERCRELSKRYVYLDVFMVSTHMSVYPPAWCDH